MIIKWIDKSFSEHYLDNIIKATYVDKYDMSKRPDILKKKSFVHMPVLAKNKLDENEFQAVFRLDRKSSWREIHSFECIELHLLNDQGELIDILVKHPKIDFL